MEITIFLFHRDLRIYDQNALQAAIDSKLPVLPMFIFTPEQVGDSAIVKSEKAIGCLKRSVKELNEDLEHYFDANLYIVKGDTISELQKVSKEYMVKYIYETEDFTPYAKIRQEAISEFCESIGAKHILIDDLYLYPVGSFLTGGTTAKKGRMFQKFKPFYDASLKVPVPKPTGKLRARPENFVKHKNTNKDTLKFTENKDLAYRGGREEGEKLLRNLPKDYDKTKDFMALPTSGLSVHHHNGTVSVRETYHRAETITSKQAREDFQRQLIWRDYYGNMINFFEELYGQSSLTFDGYARKGSFGEGREFDFDATLKALTPEQRKNYEDWCNGTTGIDLVDAGMRQLNISGYMHNRCRLLTSSYLIRDLGLHWRLGERYFANHLLDYDYSQNICNWLFQSSLLPFGRAPFRKDSAENYEKKFDKKREYIEYWLSK